jgi:23S rRNA pseudouridine1911/1915/1917 synthase
MNEPAPIEHVVAAGDPRDRLDKLVVAAVAHAGGATSRAQAQRWIDAGRVLVDGRAGRASGAVAVGARVAIRPLAAEAPSAAPDAAVTFTTVYEDEHLLVLDKPAGVVVHPGAGVSQGTLANALLHHAPGIAAVGGEGRPGIVHRLDRDTSGLMVVAKREEIYLALTNALRLRHVKRVYQAILWGDPGPDDGIIDLPIGRDPKDRKRMAVVRGPSGKTARTRWRVLERYGLATLVECRLETGRTHQIRVHMAALRHPVVGDPVYGGRVRKVLSLRQVERSLADNLLRLLRRQALHATELEFLHPATRETLRFTSVPPQDLRDALDRLRAFAPPPTA